jgi:hypothetical protein
MTVPISIAVLVALANVAWAVQMMTAPGPWEGFGPGLFVAGSTIVVIVTIVGLLISRARWALHLTALISGAYASAYLAIASPNVFGYAALGLATSSVIAVYGPWLGTWMRKRPSALGPGRVPSNMMLIGLFAPLVTALIQPGRVSVVYVTLPIVSVVAVWAYAQAQVWGLWLLRLGVPIATVVTAVAASTVGAVVASISYGLVLAGFAWRPEPLVMVQPLIDVPLAQRFVPLDPPTPEPSP